MVLSFSCSVVSNSLWPHGLQHSRLPVLHHLPELAQTRVHWVGDAIQPFHPVVPSSSSLKFFPASGSFLRHSKTSSPVNFLQWKKSKLSLHSQTFLHLLRFSADSFLQFKIPHNGSLSNTFNEHSLPNLQVSSKSCFLSTCAEAVS